MSVNTGLSAQYTYPEGADAVAMWPFESGGVDMQGQKADAV